MEQIIRILLLEGLDEDTIHRVLDVIEEEYEFVQEESEAVKGYIQKQKAIRRNLEKRQKGLEKEERSLRNSGQPWIDKFKEVHKTGSQVYDTNKRVATLVRARKESLKASNK